MSTVSLRPSAPHHLRGKYTHYYIRPSHWETILSSILYIMILGGSSYIFMYKAWILYFNASYYESNNWLFFTLCVLSLFIFALIGLIPFHYQSFEYKLILFISSLIPCIITIIISNKMYYVDDIFKLKRNYIIPSIWCNINYIIIHFNFFSFNTFIIFIMSIYSISFLIFKCIFSN
eukprot:215626_1